MNAADERWTCPGQGPDSGGVAELPLLLLAEEVAWLEKTAQRRGLTVGQLLRRMVRAVLVEGQDGSSRRDGLSAG